MSDVTLLFKRMQCFEFVKSETSDENINSLIDKSLLHDYFDEVVQLVIVSHCDLFDEQCNEISDY